MFDFVKKLLLAKELKMEKGTLTVLNKPFMMLPVSTVTNLIKNNPECSNALYLAARDAGREFGRILITRYGVGRRIDSVLVDVFSMSGWGELEVIEDDYEKKEAVFRIKKSPFATEYGISKEPVCHTNRGFLAGGGSEVMGSLVHCVETRCMAQGNSFCEFILKEAQKFKKDSTIVKKQLQLEG